MTKFCTNCKHHVSGSDHDWPYPAHSQRCAKFTEDGRPIPCVMSRGSEDKCGNAGKLWEPEE